MINLPSPVNEVKSLGYDGVSSWNLIATSRQALYKCLMIHNVPPVFISEL